MSAKILVVDDEPAIREYLQTVLTEEGYTVLTATNGRDALPVASYPGGSSTRIVRVLPKIRRSSVCRRRSPLTVDLQPEG